LNNKPQPADWLGWRQLLEFGERLMATPSVVAQVELILATAARLSKGQVDIWLADVFFRLPGLEELTSFATSSPSQLMRFVIETGQVYRHASADGEPGPLDVAVPLMANDSLLGVLQVARGRDPAFSLKREALPLGFLRK
jgi:hypothetical protein